MKSKKMVNLNLILNSLKDGILLLDKKCAILQANDSAKNLFITQSEPDKKITLFDLDIDGKIKEAVREAIVAPDNHMIELEINRAATMLLVDLKPINNHDNYFLLTIKDITKQRKLDTVRRDFIANVSHELKTPITGIKLLADAICQSPDSEIATTKHFTERLEKETSRLAQLVNDLLDLSKLESVEPKFEYFDLAGLLLELGDEFKQKAAAKNISLLVNADKTIPFFQGNPEQLELLIINLLDNAIRYTQPEGKIAINLFFKRQKFILEVEDNGIGIPKKDINRIFERFYRVDKARSRQKGGTGLGLSIVKHVVQNHHGSIKVDSQVKVGTKFTLSLPAD